MVDKLHIERATNAFNKSCSNFLRLIEQAIEEAIQKGEFSCMVPYNNKLPECIVKTIKTILEGANYEVKEGYGLMKDYLFISWITNEERIKDKENENG